MTRIRVLLAAWCLAVLAGGVLPYLLDATAGLDVAVGAGTALSWVGGYLVQFGLMMAILITTKRMNTILPWLAASMLPWLIDWTVPASAWLFAVWVPVVVGYAYWLDRSHDHKDSVLHNGVRGTATVLAIVHHFFQTVVNNAYIRRTLRLSVRTETGETFETTMTGTFPFGSEPSPGDTFAVRIDPAHPKRVVVDDRTMDHERLSGNGIRARGVVRAVHPRHTRNGVVRCRLDLSVTQDKTGLHYDAHLEAPFPADRVPTAGDRLSLLADPDDFTRVMLASEAAAS